MLRKKTRPGKRIGYRLPGRVLLLSGLSDGIRIVQLCQMLLIGLQ